MAMNRRDFLKRTGAGTALLIGGSGLIHSRAFSATVSKSQETSNVSFVGSSQSGTRKQMILDVLEPWRSAVSSGIQGKTVLIKPNVVTGSQLAATHVDAIRGLIEFIRSISQSVPIIVGECSTTPDPTWYFNSVGYNSLQHEYSDVTIVNLNNTSNIPSVDCQIWNTDFTTTTTIPISSAFVDDNYYVISICRPKTHNCMVMTGVNKNILMAAPLTNIKSQMHGQVGWTSGKNQDENKCLAYNLYQLANIIYAKHRPALNVLDAWEGMQGDGPVSGTSIMQYCAIAGEDPLAVDRLCARLMGFSDTPTEPMDKNTPSYTDMRYLVWISNAGFGNYDINKINFIHGSLAELDQYKQNYILSSNYTGDPSYETNWTGGPPPRVLDSTSVINSRFLDPKPFLVPQISGPVRGDNVTIGFTLPVEYSVEMGIYNLRGIEVCNLGKQFLSAGRYSIVWNGRDNSGSRVPSGKYIIRLKYGSRMVCDHVTIRR
ncbi:MAG TPA: DUF362 domain-containing protein [Chitinispirillaceae bacterium]|nr:DUF362 domain-containing protein [Chitinispirillaceae bacterium]